MMYGVSLITHGYHILQHPAHLTLQNMWGRADCTAIYRPSAYGKVCSHSRQSRVHISTQVISRLRFNLNAQERHKL